MTLQDVGSLKETDRMDDFKSRRLPITSYNFWIRRFGEK